MSHSPDSESRDLRASDTRTGSPHEPMMEDKATVALFVTCLVNSLRPGVGFAAAKLLHAAGFTVVVPETQSCCGQPNDNNGDPASARRAARGFIEAFEAYPSIVVPSASCAGMIRNHYPRLLKDDPEWLARFARLQERIYELADFLWIHHARLPVNTGYKSTLTHHDSCSALREMKVTPQVRRLLSYCLPNANFAELAEPEACCGFGGTFCIKFNAVSRKMGNNKLTDINSTGAEVATSLDSGCILHLQSLQQRDDKEATPFMHLAELLAQRITP